MYVGNDETHKLPTHLTTHLGSRCPKMIFLAPNENLKTIGNFRAILMSYRQAYT